MYEFLDGDYKKRLILLNKINLSEDSVISRQDLANTLNVSKKTVANLIAKIDNDLDEFEFSDKLKIYFNEQFSLYKLWIADDFSLQLLRMCYLEQSIKFQLLKNLLTRDLISVDDTSARLHTTPSTLRRELKQLKNYFKEKSLPIGIKLKGNIALYGNELAIRSFYTSFYVQAFGAEKWPFKFISYKQITNIISYIPEDVRPSESIEKSIILHYYFAITLLRIKIKKNIFIENTRAPLYNAYIPKDQEELGKFRLYLKKYLPQTSSKILALESLFILSTVLSLGSYKNKSRAPLFFYLNPELQEKKFMHTVFSIMSYINQYTIKPINNTEYNTLLYKICTIHYRIMYFDSNLIKEFLDWGVEDNSYLLQKQRYILFKTVIKNVLNHPEFSHLKKHDVYLIDQYSKALNQTLSVKKYDPVVSILFISKYSKAEMCKKIVQAFQPYINIDVVENLNDSIDVIISDVAISSNMLEINYVKSKIIYINNPSKINLNNIGMIFNEIIKKKIENYITAERQNESQLMQ